MEKIRSVIAYENYFEDFLEQQTPRVQDKILQVLRILEMVEVIPRQYLKRIEGTRGLYEIRIPFNGNSFRVFCFFDSGKMIILLGGFQKKSSKTPRREIDRNNRLMNKYFTEKVSGQ